MAHPADICDQFRRTTFHPLLEAFRIEIDAENLTSATQETYFWHLRDFVRFATGNGLEAGDVTRHTIQEYILSQKGRASAHSTNSRLRVIRVFFNFLVREGYWDKESPMSRIKMIRASKPIKKVVTQEQVGRVIRALLLQRTFESQRNGLMLMVFWDGMIRKRELQGLTLDDVNFRQKYLLVRGKGRKERLVPLGSKTLKQIHKYLMKWRKGIPGQLLFCKRSGEQLMARHIYQTCVRLSKKCEMKMTPHLLRHSAATWYASQPDANIAWLQMILGHESISTTQKYLHMDPMAVVRYHVNKSSPADGLKL